MVRTPPEILAVATAVLLGVAVKVRPSPVNHPLRMYFLGSAPTAISTDAGASAFTVGLLLVVVGAATVTVISWSSLPPAFLAVTVMVAVPDSLWLQW